MPIVSKLTNSLRRLSHRRTTSRVDEMGLSMTAQGSTSGSSDGGGSGKRREKDRQNSTGSERSIGAVDPDALAKLPIGAEWHGVYYDPTSATATTTSGGATTNGTAGQRPASVFSETSTTDSPAHSFDSIDTISDRSGRDSPDAAAETHRRTRKLLKYSRWIRNRTQDGEDGEGGEKNKSVLALERKMARQEEKLNALHLDRGGKSRA